MPRLRAEISGRRLREMVEAALAIFSRQGYERSQIADVAKVMGVAVGTIYLYVEGKEALFDLVVRHTATDDPTWLDDIEIPCRTPAPGSTVAFLREVFGRKGQCHAFSRRYAWTAPLTPDPNWTAWCASNTA